MIVSTYIVQFTSALNENGDIDIRYHKSGRVADSEPFHKHVYELLDGYVENAAMKDAIALAHTLFSIGFLHLKEQERSDIVTVTFKWTDERFGGLVYLNGRELKGVDFIKLSESGDFTPPLLVAQKVLAFAAKTLPDVFNEHNKPVFPPALPGCTLN